VPGATPAKFGFSVEGADDPIQVGRPGTPEAEMVVKLPKWADGSPVVSASKTHD
jgi:hypothetical protein